MMRKTKESWNLGPVSEGGRENGVPVPSAEKERELGVTSLVVQWVRFCAPQSRGPGFDPWSGN